MPSSSSRRRRGRAASEFRQDHTSSSDRPLKKHKTLDAINANPTTSATTSVADAVRRSSRSRHAPSVLDSSPVPSGRRRNAPSPSPTKSRGRTRSRNNEDGSGEMLQPLRSKGEEEWKSRLRTRVGKGFFQNKDFEYGEDSPPRGDSSQKDGKEKVVARKGSGELQDSDTKLGRRRRKRTLRYQVDSDDDEDAEEEKEANKVSADGSMDRLNSKEMENDSAAEANDDGADSRIDVLKDDGDRGSSDDNNDKEEEEDEKVASDVQIEAKEVNEVESTSHALVVEEDEEEHQNAGEKEKLDEAGDEVMMDSGHQPEETGPEANGIALSSEVNNDVEALKEDNVKVLNVEDKSEGKEIKEGRRCGLCGGGTDGRPPKRVDQETIETDRDSYDGSSASEEPNYDVWDGFGNEPGWLGRLLGPLRDRFGIARVWVHQLCAVWSPEVYFAELGCLKNVRAALCRGRALKCSRCGRPGATIGCRVDRCPKTYHLPCSRVEGCVFDHRKFLIACNDHGHLFQPQGNAYIKKIRKLKLKKLKLDMRKSSHDALRRDLEAEDKWLENCGEDEEFLKREGRRLHRDLLRIAPVYIGGTSENERPYSGWEAVAGLQDVIKCLKEVVILPLLYPEFYANLGITPPRGVLLHGYPGTGKTLVVRSLIGACSRGDRRIAYFARKGADCLGKYVGDAERQLRLLFQVAEKSQPSIIFFDEIDGLAPSRSRHQDQTHNSVVATLLSLLDGLKSRGSVIVIGATNRPDAVDPALRRPGRFDREIYFPLPTLKDRMAILSLHTKSWPKPLSGSLLSLVADQTAGYAGADLQALCTQAAMNALKRVCPLEELLRSAENCSVHGGLPSLPSIIVEERDWLTALAAAPPPCSRREAGMAANTIVSSPLDLHLVPSLLKPLVQFLISLYIDERIWLPPPLANVSKSIRSIVISFLEQRRVPVGFWWTHLHSSLQQPYATTEIEKCLANYGLVSGRPGSNNSNAVNNEKENHDKFDGTNSNPTSASSQYNSNQKPGRSGFRALITGLPRSGQQHLAGCLIHGFAGHMEIQKVNLATMLQEGNGDAVCGLTHILLKCSNLGRCLIYMPRIDLWAIDGTTGQEQCSPKTSLRDSDSPDTEPVNYATRIASEAWSLFVEQLGSASASPSIIILATCEMQFHLLPLGIRQFFTDFVFDGKGRTMSEHSIPRFLVALEGNFDYDLLINSCSAKLSADLAQIYVQLMHHRMHVKSYSDGQANVCYFDNSLDHQAAAAKDGKGSPSAIQVDSNLIASKPEVSFRVSQNQVNTPESTQSKLVKGSSMLAIAAFGHQILRSPHFAELCWITSKLKEGPVTDTNGPWKGWPFNSCLIDTGSSLEKVISGVNNNPKDRESGIVRGLVAVGLLAYKGAYSTVREVSSEVRKVLELLVGQIKAKVAGGKDWYQYLRILSQVAYLEDTVNSWAYSLRSLPVENSKGTSDTKQKTLAVNIVATAEKPVVQPVPDEINVELKEHSSQCSGPVAVGDGSCEDVPPDVSFRENETIAQPAFDSCRFPSSSVTANILVNGGETCKPECVNTKNLESEMNFKSSGTMEGDASNLITLTDPRHLEATGSGSETGESVAREHGTASVQENCRPNDRSTCHYRCCSECLNALYILVRKMLSDSWRSNDQFARIDDAHDFLATFSLNLIAVIRKFSVSESSSEEIFREQNNMVQREFCACQGINNNQIRRILPQDSAPEVGLLLTECCCHPRDSGDMQTDTPSDSSLPVLNFCFQDGVLIPLGSQVDMDMHCSFKKLCLCSVLEMILNNDLSMNIVQ